MGWLYEFSLDYNMGYHGHKFACPSSDDLSVGGVFGKRKCAREAVPRASGNEINTLDECRQLVAGTDAQQLLRLKFMDFDKIAPRLATYIGPKHFFLTPVGRFVRLAEHYKTN